MPKSAFPTRRELLQASAASAVAAPLVLPSGLFGADAPSNRITVGFIGLGNHGHGYNLQYFLQQKDCQPVAVCDVYGHRRSRALKTIADARGDKGVGEYADFRELLADDSIDAVNISTPDHWHTPISLAALEAGKDVMCEKPTLTIAEGRTLVNAVKKHNAVYQCGLEDRGVIQYYKIAEAVRNGAIGKLHTITVGLPPGEDFPLEKPAPVPEDLDWNLWLGPAPMVPFTPTRTGAQQWRNIRDYSGGKLADWGAHLIDTAQVCNFAGHTTPVEVEGEGQVPKNAMSTMPQHYKLKYTYANGVVMHVDSSDVKFRCEGDKGWVGNTGWRGRLEGSDLDVYRRTYEEGQSKIWPMPVGEHRNFLDCIKSRKPTTYTAEIIHRLSTVMHLGNIAMWTGRKLKWDPDAEQFPGDSEANALRTREARDWQSKA